MKLDELHWMEYSLQVANSKNDSNLKVGVVAVVKEQNREIKYYSENNRNWEESLLDQLYKNNVKLVNELYLTINTLKDKCHFNLNKVLKNVTVKNIYIGLPDPNLNLYYKNDKVINQNNIYRYPDTLQIKILQQNQEHYKNSNQSIENNPYYASKRISRLLQNKLKQNGITISYKKILENKDITKLIRSIANNNEMHMNEIKEKVIKALSESFDTKYSNYNYSNDLRSKDTSWKKKFIALYRKNNFGLLKNQHILNVGVGNGEEAKELFRGCKYLTFVDIAPSGLNNIKKELYNSSCILSSADDLSTISPDSYDLYISLRTYNSSFFNIKKSLLEAYRILKNKSTIMISVSNGFLNIKQNKVIPGLLIPNTDFVDIYRGFDLVKNIRSELGKLNCKHIKIFFNNSDIYIVSKINKDRKVGTNE